MGPTNLSSSLFFFLTPARSPVPPPREVLCSFDDGTPWAGVSSARASSLPISINSSRRLGAEAAVAVIQQVEPPIIVAMALAPHTPACGGDGAHANEWRSSCPSNGDRAQPGSGSEHELKRAPMAMVARVGTNGGGISSVLQLRVQSQATTAAAAARSGSATHPAEANARTRSTLAAADFPSISPISPFLVQPW